MKKRLKKQLKKTYAFILAPILSFSTLALPLSTVAKPAKLAVCAACHGTNGVGTLPNYPNLKGQKKAYLLKQLKDYKKGVRKDPNMNGMAAMLTDKDMEELADYYSKLK